MSTIKDRLSEIEAYSAAATPGPLREGINGNLRAYGPDGTEHAGCIAQFYGRRKRENLHAFTRSATDLPDLLQLVREQQQEIAAMKLRLEAATVFQVGKDGFGYDITIHRCEGHRLPKQPYMWAVRSMGNVLRKDGEWQYEPQPSSRDAEFYAECRFDTYDDASSAASAAIDAAQQEPRNV